MIVGWESWPNTQLVNAELTWANERRGNSSPAKFTAATKAQASAADLQASYSPPAVLGLTET